MHTIDHPPVRTYYITTHGGVVSSYGYVEPTNRLDSSADTFETFLTKDAMDTRLSMLGVMPEDCEPNPDADAATARIVLTARVNRLRGIKLSQPVTYMGHPFDSDETALQNLTGMVGMIGVGVPVPPNFGWRGADNVTVPMTAQQLVGLAGTMLSYRSACYQASWALKAALETAEDPRTVDLLAGWPA